VDEIEKQLEEYFKFVGAYEPSNEEKEEDTNSLEEGSSEGQGLAEQSA